MEQADEEKLLEDAIAALDLLLEEVGCHGGHCATSPPPPCQVRAWDGSGLEACACGGAGGGGCGSGGGAGGCGDGSGSGYGGGGGLLRQVSHGSGGSCEASAVRLQTTTQQSGPQSGQQSGQQQLRELHHQQHQQHQRQLERKALHATLLAPQSHSQPHLEPLGNDQRPSQRLGNHLNHLNYHHPQPHSAPDPDAASAVPERRTLSGGGGGDGQAADAVCFTAVPPAAEHDRRETDDAAQAAAMAAMAAVAAPGAAAPRLSRIGVLRRRGTTYLVTPEQDQVLARAMARARRMSDTVNSPGDAVLLGKRSSGRSSMQDERVGTEGGTSDRGGTDGGGGGAGCTATSFRRTFSRGRNDSRRLLDPVVLANTELLNDMVDVALANRPDEGNGGTRGGGAGGAVRGGAGTPRIGERRGGGGGGGGLDKLLASGGGGGGGGGGGRLGTEHGLMLWTGNKSRVERARLAVRLLQATDLSRTKEDKQIDPYAVVSCEGKSYTSKAVMKSKDPFWDEFFVFDVPQPAFAELKVKVYDHLRCWRPVFMGQVRIPVKSIAEFPTRYTQPSWHQMRSRAGKPKGQVQMQLFYTAEWVHRALNVLACTWNVGNAEPPQDLNPWLQGVQSLQHDLVAIGVQECLYKVGGGSVMDTGAQMAEDEYGYNDEDAPGYEVYSNGAYGRLDNADNSSYYSHDVNGGANGHSHTNGTNGNAANGHVHAGSIDNGNGNPRTTNGSIRPDNNLAQLEPLAAIGSGLEGGAAPTIAAATAAAAAAGGLGRATARPRLSLVLPAATSSSAAAISPGGGVSPAAGCAVVDGDFGGQTTDGNVSTPRSGLATRESSVSVAAPPSPVGFSNRRPPPRARTNSSLMPYTSSQMAAAALHGPGSMPGTDFGGVGGAVLPPPPRLLASSATRRRHSTFEPPTHYRPGHNRPGHLAGWPPHGATYAGMAPAAAATTTTAAATTGDASFSSAQVAASGGSAAAFARPSLSNAPGPANSGAGGGSAAGGAAGPRGGGGGAQGKVVQQTYKSKGMLTDMAKVGGEFRDLWEERLKEAVGPGYFMVASAHMGQIRLLLFARNDVYAAISDVRTGKQATGVAGVATNKGGVGISLRVWETTIAFVNSHLAAHQDRTRARNNNYRDIIRGLKLDWQGSNMDVLTAFHHVVWVGDLNYRLNYGQQAVTPTESPAPADFASLVAEVHAGAYSKLLEVDQLRREMEAKRVFLGFHEGLINFEPSFKVLRRRGYEYTAQRSPAYCDRILYRSNLPLKQIRVVSYFSPPEISTSDHKPVAAVLVVPTVWRTTMDEHGGGGSGGRSHGLSGNLAGSETTTSGGGGGSGGFAHSHFIPRSLHASHQQPHGHVRLIFTLLRAHGLFMLRSRRRSTVTTSAEFPSTQLLLSAPCMRERVVRSRVAAHTREPLWADVEHAGLGPIVVDLISTSLAEMAHFRLWARVLDLRGAERGPRLGSGGGGGGKGEGGGGGGKGDGGGGGGGVGGSMLARGVLPLLDAVTTLLQDVNGVTPFKVTLELHGLPAGFMEGTMRLEVVERTKALERTNGSALSGLYDLSDSPSMRGSGQQRSTAGGLGVVAKPSSRRSSTADVIGAGGGTGGAGGDRCTAEASASGGGAGGSGKCSNGTAGGGGGDVGGTGGGGGASGGGGAGGGFFASLRRSWTTTTSLAAVAPQHVPLQSPQPLYEAAEV